MKKVAFSILSLLVAGGIGVGVAASRYEATYVPGAHVGTVSVGGLTPTQAEDKLKKWWGASQMDMIRLESSHLEGKLPPMSANELGLTLDILATLREVPLDTFADAAARKLSNGEGEKKAFELKWGFDPSKSARLAKFVEDNRKPAQPAKVRFEKGQVLRSKEVPSVVLDQDKLQGVVVDALSTDLSGEIPLKKGEPKIKDEDFAKIKEIIGQYTTNFPSYQAARNTNIRLASSKIDGLILLPGEEFSFNTIVGRRTVKEGYREAPVLVNGRHDTGIGGGICQVSTTLYNAALFANLAITDRRNHSLASAYCPPGRDATVDFGSQDFKFKNTLDYPIAVARAMGKSSITFYILGTKVPGQDVKIVGGRVSYGGVSVKYVSDPSLPAGRTRVVEKGGSRKSVTTWRQVFLNGKLVKSESLGTSFYPGGTRVIARGTRASKPKPTAAPAAPAPVPAPAPAGQ